MTARPLFEQSTDQLDQLAQRNWDDAKRLENVRDELSFRNRPKAQQLLRRIERRLFEMTPKRPKAEAKSRDDGRMAALEAALATAQAQALHWQRLYGEAKTAAKPNRDPRTQLYAQIWLVPDCPSYVLDAAKRAIRKEHHPDRVQGVDAKRHAEEQFKRFEIIFERVAEERK